MIANIVLLVLAVLLIAAIVIAHHKKADAWAVLATFPAKLLAWLKSFKHKDSGNAGKGTQ